MYHWYCSDDRAYVMSTTHDQQSLLQSHRGVSGSSVYRGRPKGSVVLVSSGEQSVIPQPGIIISELGSNSGELLGLIGAYWAHLDLRTVYGFSKE